MTKNELKQYRTIKLELDQMDQERECWYTKAEMCVRSPSRSPGYAGEHDPYPDIIDKLDEVRTKIAQKCCELLDLRRRIEDTIDGLDSKERYIIRARYIDGLKWERIAEILEFKDTRQAYRLHGYAITNISKCH